MPASVKKHPAVATERRAHMPAAPGLLANVVVLIVLAAITVAVFYQTGDHEFLFYDDNEYVTENPHLQQGVSVQGIRWAFSTNWAANWHPLTWLSHMLDVQFYGLNPRGHHLTNVAIHALNACLLFVALLRLTGNAAETRDKNAQDYAGRWTEHACVWQCAFVAALFALHPLHVESVAWVAERKDLLASFFGMLALWTYAGYVQRPSVLSYFLVAFCLALGLMSKPTLVTLPIVLLLLDYWPLCRWPNWGAGWLANSRVAALLIAEKLPWLALSLSSALATIWAQRGGGAVVQLDLLPWSARIPNAFESYAAYLVSFAWPTGLAVFYPHPYVQKIWPSPWWAVGAATGLVAVTVVAAWQARRQPYLIVGWLWYLLMLFPMIGVIQVGSQARADRYTYLSLIGISIMLAWGTYALASRWRDGRAIWNTAAVICVAGCAFTAYVQTGYWRTNTTLFRHAAKVTKDNYLVYEMLGHDRIAHHDLAAAIDQFQIAVDINPDLLVPRTNLANALIEQSKVLLKRGRVNESLDLYRRACRTRPDSMDMTNALAWLLATREDARPAFPGESIELAQKVCQKSGFKRPDYLDTLAAAFAANGRFDDAIETQSKAIELVKAQNQTEVVGQLESRRKLYAAGQAYREP